MGKIHDGRLLYHLTKLSNLDSIIEHGLISRRVLNDKRTEYDDIADPQIVSKRMKVELDRYIPFHFHPYSSFDVAVKNTYNSDVFIYLCISREFAREHNFLIIPKHPLNLHDVNLLNYDEGFQSIDWNHMEKSSSESAEARLVRMAECLSDKPIPLNCFQSIAVEDDAKKRIIEGKLQKCKGRIPYVNIQPWFTADNR